MATEATVTAEAASPGRGCRIGIDAGRPPCAVAVYIATDRGAAGAGAPCAGGVVLLEAGCRGVVQFYFHRTITVLGSISRVAVAAVETVDRGRTVGVAAVDGAAAVGVDQMGAGGRRV